MLYSKVTKFKILNKYNFDWKSVKRMNNCHFMLLSNNYFLINLIKIISYSYGNQNKL